MNLQIAFSIGELEYKQHVCWHSGFVSIPKHANCRLVMNKNYTFGSQSLHFSILTSFLQIGGGELPDETTLLCSRGSDRFAKI